MAFADLSTSLQNLVMVYFDFFAKLFLIVGLFLVCLYFTNTFDMRDRSPFIAIRYMKGLTFIAANVYKYLFPLMIFFLFPQVSLNVLLTVLVAAYSVIFVVFGFIVAPINMIMYGGAFASDLIGISTRGAKIRDEVDKVVGLNK